MTVSVESFLADVPGRALDNLQRADALWSQVKQGTLPVPAVAFVDEVPLGNTEWDVAIAGGTLGILMGAALAQRGWKVVVIERGILRGREQEWNVSRRELEVFLRLGLLTAAELEVAIASEYNPARVKFVGGKDIWVRDVLNIGVDPAYLLDALKAKFLAAGGYLVERAPFVRAIVRPDGVEIVTEGEAESKVLRARLLLDAMGHFSPIARQARGGKQPDGICLVVGTCARGFADNDTGDLLVTLTPVRNHCQYFWEAFPARDGRTTYLFTYLDADRDRLSLTDLFADYLRLLPEYQGVELGALEVQRALFGMFPCYRNSPLAPTWNRILAIGDSSGNQSPLSFGGFGAMLRHLERLDVGLDAALRADCLDCASLALLQPYQPNLAVTWLFQKAMSVGQGQVIAPDSINRLLGAVFTSMQQSGDPVLRPFLQDIVQFPALTQALFRTAWTHPGEVARVVPRLGFPALMNWMSHYVALGSYEFARSMTPALSAWVQTLPPARRYTWQQRLQALTYGAGADYEG
ncbi:MAG: FAD-binding oxidoreductase [Cyanobacteria bacterium P01_D01_bin.123]